MANFFTSDTLIADVQRRAMIPNTQQTFQEADFLAFANEELLIGCVPHVLSFHQEYFVHTQFVPLVANTSRYPIPTRAIGTKLRDVSYMDVSGNIFEMSRIKIEDIPSYQNNVIQNSFTLFYMEGNDLMLIPVVGANPVGTLRFSYYIRPNEMVPTNQVGIVNGIASGALVNNYPTTVVTLSNIPSTFNLTEPLDIVQTQNPFQTIGINITPLAMNTITNTLTFYSYQISLQLMVGDHIALAEQTIVPQIPADIHSMLSQRVAARCLEALGDTQGLQNANLKLTEMENKTGTILEDRVEGQPLKVFPKHSALKRKKLYWRS